MDKEKQLSKFKKFFQIMDAWMTLKENDQDIDKILYHAGYKKIAIYGMGRICMHMIKALRDSAVEIVYVIDKNSCELFGNIKVYDLTCDLEGIDVVIYTNPDEEKEVLNELKKKFQGRIISLADVVFDNLPLI